MSRFEVRVAGRFADSLLEVITNRFGRPATRRHGATTTITVGELDRASERALLTLLWDTGHDIVSTRSIR